VDPVKLTLGEMLLLTNLKAVASMRGWGLKKTIAKLQKILAVLEQMRAEKAAPAQAPDVGADPSVLQAEQFLRDLQQQDDDKPDDKP
jgi:hypothetical protein